MDGILFDIMFVYLVVWEVMVKYFDFLFDVQWFYGLGGMLSVKIMMYINKKLGLVFDFDCVVVYKMDWFVSMGL